MMSLSFIRINIRTHFYEANFKMFCVTVGTQPILMFIQIRIPIKGIITQTESPAFKILKIVGRNFAQ